MIVHSSGGGSTTIVSFPTHCGARCNVGGVKAGAGAIREGDTASNVKSPHFPSPGTVLLAIVTLGSIGGEKANIHSYSGSNSHFGIARLLCVVPGQ